MTDEGAPGISQAGPRDEHPESAESGHPGRDQETPLRQDAHQRSETGPVDPTREAASAPVDVVEQPEDAVEAEHEDRIELDLPSREPSGDPTVDAILDRVDEARGAGLQAHLDAAETAQNALQQRLSDTGD